MLIGGAGAYALTPERMTDLANQLAALAEAGAGVDGDPVAPDRAGGRAHLARGAVGPARRCLGRRRRESVISAIWAWPITSSPRPILSR
ncbi:MAG: hypothetical protein WDN69_18775 [Aliidongia sp.]